MSKKYKNNKIVFNTWTKIHNFYMIIFILKEIDYNLYQ